ncbi:MAG TPA: hypothetical protein VGN17_04885 [Bryobacteraceae bacterium]|jgi:hypothetical protein
MKSPLHPLVFKHLRSVQASDKVGLHGFFRRNHDAPRSSRTVYRWQRSLGDQLLVVPNVLVERLGLRHAHVFVVNPDPSWLSLPYAVESAWVTPDFCQEVLYLHCLVPVSTVFADVLARYPCARVEVVWSGSGWQSFLQDDYALGVTKPVPPGTSDLARRLPFVIPAMLELWTYPNSLPLGWARIRLRLGTSVRQYLPRTRIQYVNGKTHLTAAFRALKEEALLQQQLIRYHPLLAQSVEVFLTARMDHDEVLVFLQRLRPCLHAIETYPMEGGYWCRLLGPHRLLDAIINVPTIERERLSGVHFHTKRHPTPVVRFHYETLFDPTKGNWRTA